MKWTCLVCGTKVDGETPPVRCPRCKVPADRFTKEDMGKEWEKSMAPFGIAKDVDADIKEALRMAYEKQCGRSGVSLAMARAAYQEGYQEIGAFLERAAREDSAHAAELARMLGETVRETTRANLEMDLNRLPDISREMDGLSSLAGNRGQDAVYAVLKGMTEDTTRRQSALSDLYQRYF